MFFKIDKKLIDDIRLLPQYKEFCFGIEEDNEIIVTNNQTHEYLMRNLPINDYILRFYYATNKRLISYSEFENLKKRGYFDSFEFAIQPYNIKIFGAFHAPSIFALNLISISYLNICHIDGKKVEDLSELIPYFLEYSNGFKVGYNTFYNDEIKPLLIESYSDKSDYLDKIFEFITKKTNSNHCWQSNNDGFSFDCLKNNSLIISSGFDVGRRQGRFYKAWSLIFASHNLFASRFEKYELENGNPFEPFIPKNIKKETESFKKEDSYLKEMHNQIFKGNAFDVWQYMFNEFGINESSRTDVKFMFEEMRKEELIHNTVNQKTFLEWITSTYDGIIIEKTSNHNRTNSRLQTYARAKKLYKE
jgi:hypothetical protein